MACKKLFAYCSTFEYNHYKYILECKFETILFNRNILELKKVLLDHSHS